MSDNQVQNSLIRIFYLVLPCYFFVDILVQGTFFYEFTLVNRLRIILMLIILLLSLVLMTTFKYRYQEVAILILSIPLVVFAAFKGSNEWMMLLFISITIAKIDFRKCFIRLFYTVVAIFVITILSNQVGIIGEYNMFRDVRMRYSLGFVHPNVLALLSFLLILYFFCFVLKKRSIVTYSIALVFCIWTYYVTSSRTSLYVTIFFLVIHFLIGLLGNRVRRVLKVGSILPIGFLITSAFFSINYSPISPFYSAINRLLSYRVQYAHSFISTYGLSLFGNRNLVLVSTKEASQIFGLSAAVVDNAFILYSLYDGIILIVWILLFLTYLILFLSKQGKSYLVLGIISFLIFGMFERYLFNYTFNFFLLMVWIPFARNKDDNGGKI